jgi:hypothetical protein
MADRVFQYRFFERLFDHSDDATREAMIDEHAKWFNELGAEGWEVVQIAWAPLGFGNRVSGSAWAKREING